MEIEMKNPRVGIIGYFGHGNAGDEAMKDILLQEFPNSVANNRDKIEKCDAYIIAGGDLIQGFSGLHLPKIWDSITDEPCYAISLGVKSGWEKYEAKVTGWLKKFRKVYTREQESYNILNKFIKVDGVMPDLVLLADAPKDSQNYPIIFNYTDRPWVNPDGQFEDIKKNIDSLEVGLAEDFDSKYAKKIVDYKTFLSMAKSSKGVIGARLHAVVMGVIAGVPVAGIAYEKKVKKFCDRYEIPCFEYGKKNGKLIVESLRLPKIDLNLEREKIKAVLTEIKNDLYEKN